MTSSRRRFLGLSLATAASYSRVSGANERVRVGLIGCGGRGRYVAGFMSEAPDAEFVAVADVCEAQAQSAKQWAGGDAAAYSDFRRVLERKDVDAVLVATPDHWHADVTVLACQAGKDVYVEKPLAHNIREGRVMVDAARRYNRIVQAGTQHRSAPHYRGVQHIVQSGELGEVHFVRVWNYVNMLPDGIGRVADSDVAARHSIGISTWDPRPRGRTTPSASVPPSAGSGTTPAAPSPTSALTASTPCTRSWASIRR